MGNAVTHTKPRHRTGSDLSADYGQAQKFRVLLIRAVIKNANSHRTDAHFKLFIDCLSAQHLKMSNYHKNVLDFNRRCRQRLTQLLNQVFKKMHHFASN